MLQLQVPVAMLNPYYSLSESRDKRFKTETQAGQVMSRMGIMN